MANSILSALTSQTLFLAKNEITGRPCWPNLKIVDVEIDAPSENTEFPISLQQYSDNGTYIDLQAKDVASIKVISPTKITVHGICPDISTIESILSTFNDTQITLSILTKGVLSNTLSITDVEITQDPDMLSAARVTISLNRTSPPQPILVYNPRQPGDQSTIGVRLQTLASGLTTTVGNLYNTVASYASSALKLLP